MLTNDEAKQKIARQLLAKPVEGWLFSWSVLAVKADEEEIVLDAISRMWQTDQLRIKPDKIQGRRVRLPEAIKFEFQYEKNLREYIYQGNSTLFKTATTRDIFEEHGLHHAAQYEKLEELGRGGYGIVYRVSRITELGKFHYAMKVFNPSPFLKDLDLAQKRFLREVKALEGMQHRGIVSYFDAGYDTEKRPFLIMSFVEGAKLWEASAGSSADEILAWMMEVASAMTYAHSKGVYHRDIKPSNIIVRETDSQPVIVDFGIAYILDGADSDSITRTGVGSAGYMPHETIADPKIRTPGHDIYSCGVTLYQMLARTLPNPSNYRSLSEFGIPGAFEIDDLIKRALAPAERRIGTMTEFHQQLRDAYKGVTKEQQLRPASNNAELANMRSRSTLVPEGILSAAAFDFECETMSSHHTDIGIKNTGDPAKAIELFFPSGIRAKLQPSHRLKKDESGVIALESETNKIKPQMIFNLQYLNAQNQRLLQEVTLDYHAKERASLGPLTLLDAKEIKIEVLEGALSLVGSGSSPTQLTLSLRLFITTKGETIIFPSHKCRAQVQFMNVSHHIELFDSVEVRSDYSTQNTAGKIEISNASQVVILAIKKNKSGRVFPVPQSVPLQCSTTLVDADGIARRIDLEMKESKPEAGGELQRWDVESVLEL